MNGLPTLAPPTLTLAPPNLPHTAALAPGIRVSVSTVKRYDDGRFRWAVSVTEEGEKIPTIRYCRTNQNGDGLEIRWIGDTWMEWLRPDQFTLTGIHQIHQMAHALEGYLSVDMDF